MSWDWLENRKPKQGGGSRKQGGGSRGEKLDYAYAIAYL
jgi:hypothetical protein